MISSTECTRGDKRCVSVVGTSSYSNFPQTYFRRRKIYDVNRAAGENDEAWDGVGLLLDALGTRGMSDDETDNESGRSNPDRRFKTLRRIDTGFLTPEIADIWTAVETYPSSARISCGNRSYRRNPKAKIVSRNRAPIPGLPANFYNPEWLRLAPPNIRAAVTEDVGLPVLVSHNAYMHSYIRTHCCRSHKMPYHIHKLRENIINSENL